jgi:hypothetical protein
MNNKKLNIVAVSLFGLASLSQVANVSAVNPYNIEYIGGAPLSASNVQIDSSISDLVPIIKTGSGEGSGIITISNSPKWETGYYRVSATGECRRYNFIRIYANNLINSDDDIYYTLSNDSYEAKMQINNVVLEDVDGLSEDGDAIAVGVHTVGSGYFSVGDILYSDSQCTNLFQGVRKLQTRDDGQVFVEMNVKLFKKGDSEPFVADEMYFGLMDIDAAQSYKILNPTNQLNVNNMFVASETAFTYPGTDGNMKNMFVPDGSYIYSQYDKENDTFFNTADVNNIYVKIDKTTQQMGINIVYGFATGAGSGIEYYARRNMQPVVDEEEDQGVLVPNTGVSTKETNAIKVVLPVVGVLIGGLVIKLIAMIPKKKIKFD